MWQMCKHFEVCGVRITYNKCLFAFHIKRDTVIFVQRTTLIPSDSLHSHACHQWLLLIDANVGSHKLEKVPAIATLVQDFSQIRSTKLVCSLDRLVMNTRVIGKPSRCAHVFWRRGGRSPFTHLVRKIVWDEIGAKFIKCNAKKTRETKTKQIPTHHQSSSVVRNHYDCNGPDGTTLFILFLDVWDTTEIAKKLNITRSFSVKVMRRGEIEKTKLTMFFCGAGFNIAKWPWKDREIHLEYKLRTQLRFFSRMQQSSRGGGLRSNLVEWLPDWICFAWSAEMDWEAYETCFSGFFSFSFSPSKNEKPPVLSFCTSHETLICVLFVEPLAPKDGRVIVVDVQCRVVC